MIDNVQSELRQIVKELKTGPADPEELGARLEYLDVYIETNKRASQEGVCAQEAQG
jgi:signal transduction histidine kinase